MVTLGKQIDALYKKRAERLALSAEVESMKAEEKIMETAIMEAMDKEDSTGSKGSVASCSISSTEVGNPLDWGAFYKYMARTKQFHLMQRRLSDPAIRELMALKGSIPGVELFTKRTLNLTKIKK